MSKILIISPCGTHPATAGNRQRVLALATAMQDAGHDVHLAVLPNTKFDTGDEHAMRAHWGKRLHMLYPFQRWTLGFRLRRLSARILNPLLRQVLRIGRSPARIDTIDNIYSDWWDVQLMQLQLQHRFNVVFAEYVFMSRALLAFPKVVRTIIDTHDIFSHRDQALRASINATSNWLSTDPASEGLALNRADAALGIQDEESTKLRELTTTPVLTVGHFIRATENDADADQNRPARILFVGSENPINVDACYWFIDNVLDKLTALHPALRFRIVGGTGAKLAARYPAHPHLEIAGRVDALDGEYAEATFVINPVQFGTGLAIKSIEALAHGKPLLCTPEGARGIQTHQDTPSPCLIATSPDDFAKQATELLTDPELCARQSMASRLFVQHWNQEQAACLLALADHHQKLNTNT